MEKVMMVEEMETEIQKGKESGKLLHYHHKTPNMPILSRLRAALLLVTLISFYYHGFSLLISCSFLNPGSIVSAAAGEIGHSYKSAGDGDAADYGIKGTKPSHRHTDGDHENYSDLNQMQQPAKRFSPTPGESQTNDILTKLKHWQGRIHDDGSYIPEENEKLGEDESINFSGRKSYNNEVPNNDLLLRDKSEGINKRYALFASPDSINKNGNENPGLQKTDKSSASDITCRDELGNEISWFIAYKLPKIASSADPLIKEGSKYYYLLPSQNSWTSSQFAIHDEKSILGQTLNVMWENNDSTQNTAQILYNDQPPCKPAVVMNGHTKGLVITSASGGLWLQHSCPHFPDISTNSFSASYPTGGLINGQMFFCISFSNLSSIDSIGSALQYTRPFVYNHSIPTAVESLIPQLTKLAQKNATVKSPPWFHTFDLAAPGDELQLKVFAKGPKFRQDMYSAWIAPDYGASLDVQSWLNGPHPLASNCTSNVYPVYNVLLKNLGNQNFSYTDDHSKWAVSLQAEKPVTCIGDLNRMKPQKTRGGVAVCMINLQIWTAFKSTVEQTQPCNSTTLKYFARHIQKKQKMKHKKHPDK